MFSRSLAHPLREALADTPVVFLHGARQTGKSTLARALVDGGWPARYLTLDDSATLAAASHDPEGFVARLERPAVLDEVQLAPELFRAVKAAVDRDRTPGGLLLTGSAHLLVLPRLADSLVGRMEVLTLSPLTQAEIEGRAGQVVDRLFDRRPLQVAGEFDHDDLVERLVHGGFPEAVGRPTTRRRRAWFDGYLDTLLKRDVRDLANIDQLAALPGLLRLLAARSASLLSLAELARSSGIARTTLKRYLGLLEGIFLVHRIPAWSSNLSKRAVKAPKVALIDSGLLCHLLGLGAEQLEREPERLGPVLESFVVEELRRLASWSETRPRLYHFRSHDGHEVDLVLEDAAGRLVAVEVKSRATVRSRDLRSLRKLEQLAGKRFLRGLVLYTGRAAVPFGERLDAMPISWLWSAVADAGDEQRSSTTMPPFAANRCSGLDDSQLTR